MPARTSKTHPPRSSLTDLKFRALPATLATRHRTSQPEPGDVIDRVRCEFFEMRGFSPTADQAARLFQIDPEECRRILKGLVDAGFLTQTADGRYRLPSQR
jgi:hypothetical protein